MIIDRPGQKTLLIEIKSTKRVTHDDIKKLSKIGKDFKNSEMVCLSSDPKAKTILGVECIYWQEGIKKFGLHKNIPVIEM